jgi:Zn-finger nucleic acid-binding protein
MVGPAEAQASRWMGTTVGSEDDGLRGRPRSHHRKPPRPRVTECPVCGAPTYAVTVEGIEIDFCEKCRATWWDCAELAAYTGNHPITFDFSHARFCDGRDDPQCPYCGVPLMANLTPDFGARLCPVCLGVLMTPAGFRAYYRMTRYGPGFKSEPGSSERRKEGEEEWQTANIKRKS